MADSKEGQAAKKRRITGRNEHEGKSEWNGGQLRNPSGLAIASMGDIYVSETSAHAVQHFDVDGKFVRKFGKLGRADGEFEFPNGVTIHLSSVLCASIFSAIRSVAALSLFPPGILPIMVAYVGTERIYVVDTGNSRVQVFELNGGFVNKFGRVGRGMGEFRHPYGCVCDNVGSVYVTDRGNYRVQVFAGVEQYKFVRQFGSYGYGIGEFVGPEAIAIAQDSLLYIVDKPRNLVYCYRTDGTHVPDRTLTFEHRESPNAIVIDDVRHALYVCEDTRPGRIRGFLVDENNAEIATLNDEGKTGDLHEPRGMAISKNQSWLYVADTHNNRIITLRLPDRLSF